MEKSSSKLIHKKNPTNDRSNFRHITLQSVPLKIFTSCARNSVFPLLKNNGFVGHQIQKGFTSNVSRTKQRSLVVTLLDLKNDFDEVHHNWIQPFFLTTTFLRIFNRWSLVCTRISEHQSSHISFILKPCLFAAAFSKVTVSALFSSIFALHLHPIHQSWKIQAAWIFFSRMQQPYVSASTLVPVCWQCYSCY